MSAKVVDLWVYPIKSCRGVRLTEMEIGPTGPRFDRQWMIVDQNNQFMTLRSSPKLAQIKTALTEKFLQLHFASNKVLISLDEKPKQVETVTVWGDTFKAGIEAAGVNEALSDFLDQEVKLVRYQDESFRELGEGKGTDVVKQTMFADSRPILLVNRASLDDLNEKLAAIGSAESFMERFRANIIVEGLEAFAEDNVKKLKVGSVELTNPKLCARCTVITQDVETGDVVSKETLKTLAGYRKIGNGVMFGVNYTPNTLGTIRVGDQIQY